MSLDASVWYIWFLLKSSHLLHSNFLKNVIYQEIFFFGKSYWFKINMIVKYFLRNLLSFGTVLFLIFFKSVSPLLLLYIRIPCSLFKFYMWKVIVKIIVLVNKLFKCMLEAFLSRNLPSKFFINLFLKSLIIRFVWSKVCKYNLLKKGGDSSF